MSVDCRTCKVFWDEFSEAVKSHVAILLKFRLAQLVEHDSAEAVELLRTVNDDDEHVSLPPSYDLAVASR